MIGIVLEQFRKIENSSRTLEHVFAGGNSENTLTKFRNLLQSQWANFNQIWHNASLCEGRGFKFKRRAHPPSQGDIIRK